MSLAHIKDANNAWTVMVDDKPYQFDDTHPDYNGLVECVRVGDDEQFVSILEIGSRVENWSDGDFVFADGILTYRGDEVQEVILNRILEMIKEGFDHKPMLRFLERLFKNPSFRSIKELYLFMTHKHIPITSDGYLLAYKYVRVHSGVSIKDVAGNIIVEGDYVDAHTGKTHRYNIGDTPSMPRYKVDDNCNNGCSAGLHVGSLNYSTGNGLTSVIVKVDPANIVSIPADGSFEKVRCTGFEVVSVFRKALEQPVNDDYDDDYDDDDDFDFSDDDDYDYDNDWS